MMRNEMAKTLIELQKKGIRIHLTDEGWKVFVQMISFNLTEDLRRGDSNNGLAV